MNGFRIRLVSLLGLLTSFVTAKAQTWIPFDNQEGNKSVTTEVVKSDQTGYSVKLLMHGLTDELVNNEMGEFHRISIGRNSFLSRVGEPSLPLFSQSIAIPSGARISAKITDEQWTDVEIGKIIPVQKPLLENELPKGFDYDEEVYSRSYTPTLLNIGKEMQWRDIRNTTVSVCPFRYYPQDNRLSVMKECVLQISFVYDNKQEVKSLSQTDDPYRLFDNIPFTDANIIQDRSESSRSANSDYYNYLIIIGTGLGISNNDSKMIEFRRWKALKGFKTKVASKDTISNIKNYIAQEYEKGIRYVLFIGDDDNISLENVYTVWNRFVASDYWYGCLDGDNDIQAELPIGRFSVGSWTDFCHMVDKTIKYESKYNSTNEALLVAHFDGYHECCEEIASSHCQQMSFMKAYGATYPYGNNATNADVINSINNGAHIINYRGHGSPVLWGKNYADEEEPPIYKWNSSCEAFTLSEINNMDSETCSVFFSIACLTGRIVEDSCMLEAFTRSDHGAVAYIGATETTDNGANNCYNKLLFDKLLDDYVCRLGDLNISAHITNYLISPNYSSNDTIFYMDNPFCYICGGDPTLELWTATPQTMNVNWTIGNGCITINTNLSGDYYVALASMDGERIDSIACSSTTCTIPIPANYDKFYLAVNKHNYFPHIIYYDSVSEEIVNEIFDYDAYYSASPLDVFSTEPSTDEGTIVKSGHKLSIKNGSDGVEIMENFKCEKGAKFEVK